MKPRTGHLLCFLPASYTRSWRHVLTSSKCKSIFHQPHRKKRLKVKSPHGFDVKKIPQFHPFGVRFSSTKVEFNITKWLGKTWDALTTWQKELQGGKDLGGESGVNPHFLQLVSLISRHVARDVLGAHKKYFIVPWIFVLCDSFTSSSFRQSYGCGWRERPQYSPTKTAPQSMKGQPGITRQMESVQHRRMTYVLRPWKNTANRRVVGPFCSRSVSIVNIVFNYQCIYSICILYSIYIQITFIFSFFDMDFFILHFFPKRCFN